MNGEGGPGNAYAYRVKLLGNELGYKGPYTYGTEEKEYWDALMSYTLSSSLATRQTKWNRNWNTC